MTASNFKPRSLLVTGGAGFIGSNFVRYQLQKDPEIRIVNLDLLTYAGSLDNLDDLPDAERHIFVEGDICDRELIVKLLEEHKIDSIVHFAAESHVDRSIDGPAAFVNTNVVGTFVMLDAAREVWINNNSWGAEQCRFHHISTDEVYGTLTATDPAFSETTPYAPNSPYSAAKAGADHLARAYFHTYGMPVVTTNCSNNYGPRQNFEKLLPTVIRCCHMQQSIPVYGDGSNIRDWLHVTDHCSGIDTVLRNGRLGECYNIGGNCEQTNLDLVKTICQVMDEVDPQAKPRESLIEFVKDRPGHDWRYAIDCSKMKAEFDWEPSYRLAGGLLETIEWYRGNKKWRQAVEVGEGSDRLGLGKQQSNENQADEGAS